MADIHGGFWASCNGKYRYYDIVAADILGFSP